MGGQDCAVYQARLVLGQQALEPQHQRVLLTPLDARLLPTRFDLGEGSVERPAAGGPRAQGIGVQRERFTCEPLDAVELFAGWNGRSLAGHFGGVSHLEACQILRTPSHARRLRNARPCSATGERFLAGGSSAARGIQRRLPTLMPANPPGAPRARYSEY